MRWVLVALLLTACDRPAPPQPAPPSARPAVEVSYVEKLPAGVSASEPLPLVIGIHGLGGRPESFIDLLDADRLGARVVAPRGLTPHGSGFSWFPIRVGAIDEQEVAPGVAHAADALASLIASLAKSRPTRGKPIVTGFSQGGILSFAIAARHPQIIAAALPIAGWLPRPLWPERAPAFTVPIVALHGDADPLLPIAPTREVVAHLKGIGFPVELREQPGVAHTITPAMRAELEQLIRARSGE